MSAGEDESVDLRTQAANIGREFERQHGDGAVGKINAGAAKTRFLIERRIRGYVLGDVGDVNLQFVISIGAGARRRRRRNRGQFRRRW